MIQVPAGTNVIFPVSPQRMITVICDFDAWIRTDSFGPVPVSVIETMQDQKTDEISRRNPDADSQ